MPTHTLRRLAAPALLLASVASVASVACSDAKRSASTDRAAAVPGSTLLNCDTTATGAAVNVAVAEFIRRADPVPQRYLSAVGPGVTPLPESGFRALKDRGPTYLYPTDSAGQATVKAKLVDVGPYTSLLVTFGGTTIAAEGNEATVRVGGSYVGGKYDGRVAAGRSVRLRCEGSTWKVASADEERSA